MGVFKDVAIAAKEAYKTAQESKIQKDFFGTFGVLPDKVEVTDVKDAIVTVDGLKLKAYKHQTWETSSEAYKDVWRFYPNDGNRYENVTTIEELGFLYK